MATTALDIISFALKRMGVYGPGDTISDADAEDALTILNDMLDSWSNENLACFANTEQSVTLSIGKNQYTIGPGGDINLTRPLDIKQGPGAAYIQDTTGNNYDVNVVTQDQWNQIGNRGSSITSNIPDTLFYDPQYPLGKINLFPTPNINWTLFFDSRLQLTTFASIAAAFSMPTGYKMALQSNLVMEAWGHFKGDQTSPSQAMAESASRSKANIKRTNLKPIIASYDGEIVSRSSSTYNIYRDR